MKPTLSVEEARQEALRRRAELQDEARSHGISEEFISKLVDEFYRRVRRDPEIGPIFNRVIGTHWPEHLAKLKRFWNSVILRTGEFDGRPMPKHIALTDATPRHFEVWLGLFEETLNDISPSAEATQMFLGTARQIGARFQSVMFGTPGHA